LKKMLVVYASWFLFSLAAAYALSAAWWQGLPFHVFLRVYLTFYLVYLILFGVSGMVLHRIIRRYWISLALFHLGGVIVFLLVGVTPQRPG